MTCGGWTDVAASGAEEEVSLDLGGERALAAGALKDEASARREAAASSAVSIALTAGAALSART